MKSASRSKYDRNPLGRFRFLKAVLVIVVLLVLAYEFIIGFGTVSGHSMEPSVPSGSFIVYSRLYRNYARGDIIGVKMPNGELLVKRIIALGGDEVDIRDGEVFVNGESESTAYVHEGTLPKKQSVEYPMTVDSDKVFILGDNREASVDSRTYGLFSTTQICGKVILIK